MQTPRCPECGSKLKIMSHRFVTGEIHCKALCEACYWNAHINKAYLELAESSYETGGCKPLKKKRKIVLKKRALKETFPKTNSFVYKVGLK